MKKIELIITIIFNIFALPLIILGIVFWILSNFGIYLYFFNQIGSVAILMCLSFGITIEGVLLFILAIMKRKIAIFLPNIILVPLVLFMVYSGIWRYSQNIEYKINNFNSSIVVHNERFLHSGYTHIFEKTSFVSVRDVGPLYDTIILSKEELIITPHENGIELSYRNIDKIYLKYVDNHFIEAGCLEDIK